MKKQNILINLAIALLLANSAYSQVTNLTTVAGPGTEFGGWDGTGTNNKDYDLRSGFGSTYNMNFWLNGNPGTKRMTILGSNGNVGMGVASPAYKLDVNGDINMSYGSVNAYKIEGLNVLRVQFSTGTYNSLFVGIGAGGIISSGVATSTFVGYNAGNAVAAGSYHNTLIGNQAGEALNTGFENTFTGSQAGMENTTGYSNSFDGHCAGRDNVDGFYNTLIGHWAGSYNISASKNTAVGAYALGSQISPIEETKNVAIGYYSLYANDDGEYNTAIGTYSGESNYTGSNNTFLGYKADASASNLDNATAIGANAEVTTSNNMLLGNNDVDVSIGLSGVSGALAKLHIQRDFELLLMDQLLTPQQLKLKIMMWIKMVIIVVRLSV